MLELSKIFLEWPGIVQGALGSCLFWLILIIGRKSIGIFINVYSKFSGKVRIHKLTDLRFRYCAQLESDDEKTEQLSGAFYSSVLTYRALRYFITGIIWLTLGLLFQMYSKVFGVVGFVGCILYLFNALSVIDAFDYKGDLKKKIQEIDNQIDKLRKT